jgi:hypothetical protein
MIILGFLTIIKSDLKVKDWIIVGPDEFVWAYFILSKSLDIDCVAPANMCLSPM